MSYNLGSNFKSASRFALIRFWNFSRDYSLNWTPLGPITITNHWFNLLLLFDFTLNVISYSYDKKHHASWPARGMFWCTILFRWFLCRTATGCLVLSFTSWRNEADACSKGKEEGGRCQLTGIMSWNTSRRPILRVLKVVIKTDRVKKVNSRKKNTRFLRGTLKCTFPGCSVFVVAKIWQENYDQLEISYPGKLRHSGGGHHGRRIKGAARDQIKGTLDGSDPSRVHHRLVSNLPEKVYASVLAEE